VPGESGPGGTGSIEAPLDYGRLLIERLERAEDAQLIGERRQRYFKVAECG
jgi:hypothetical protein